MGNENETVRKRLTEDGVPEEFHSKIMKLYGKLNTEIGTLTEAVTASNTKITSLEGELVEANKAIGELSKLDPVGTKKLNDEYQQTISTMEADRKKHAETTTLNHAVEIALLTAKPRDKNALKALKSTLDMSIIKLDKDGNVKGLSEQIEGIKTDSPYLFEGTDTTPVGQVDFGAKHEPKNDKKTDLFEEGFDKK